VADLFSKTLEPPLLLAIMNAHWLAGIDEWREGRKWSSATPVVWGSTLSHELTPKLLLISFTFNVLFLFVRSSCGKGFPELLLPSLELLYSSSGITVMLLYLFYLFFKIANYEGLSKSRLAE